MNSYRCSIRSSYREEIQKFFFIWRQTTLLLSAEQTDVVSCYKRSATLGTCCSQSSSVVLARGGGPRSAIFLFKYF